MAYWVYENWAAESKAVIHASECGSCKSGAGAHANPRGEANGKWRGPFEAFGEARKVAHATGRPVRRHRCVTESVQTAPPKPTGAAESLRPKNVADLERFGFHQAGRWALDPAAKGGVRYELTAHANDRVLYAFVVDSRVEYVGICDSSATTLQSRMSRYKNMVGAGTNARIVKLIKAVLDRAGEVLIYAMVPAGGPSHLGLSLDYVKALEFPLIAELKPTWNRHH